MLINLIRICNEYWELEQYVLNLDTSNIDDPIPPLLKCVLHNLMSSLWICCLELLNLKHMEHLMSSSHCIECSGASMARISPSLTKCIIVWRTFVILTRYFETGLMLVISCSFLQFETDVPIFVFESFVEVSAWWIGAEHSCL